MPSANTCSVCGEAQDARRIARVIVVADSLHVDDKGKPTSETAIGSTVDLCRPFSDSFAMSELGLKDPTRAAAASAQSMQCLQQLIAKNPHLTFKDQEHTAIADRWSW